MSRLRLVILLTLIASIPVLAVATLAAGATGAGRHPLAVKAEESFFATLNGNPKVRTAPLRDLMTAYAVSPDDARVNLLLGLNHLWLAAEGDMTNPTVIDHLILAEHFLARAQKLDPSDRRIPSWLAPVRLTLARIHNDKETREQSFRDIQTAYAEDPNFHSFTLALLAVDSDRKSPEFQRGLAALRATEGGCAGAEDPSCENRPRWPHNLEAFTTFFADYELKAGNADRARALLVRAQQNPDYPRWRFQSEVEDRLKNLESYAALYANADPGDDPPHLMANGGFMCQSCHSGP
ncbi:MAG TPA: hypothetical protein VF756_19030 [Thermoanaerobaculia bacterium]